MTKKNIEKRLENLENCTGTCDEKKVRALEMEAIDAFIAAVDREKAGAVATEAVKRLETVNDELRALGEEPFIELVTDE
ncbi:MAG: hypothetical protein MAG715_00423 [Methanonatronarchaeales archaeon]|nr:hypothetical protein [Methanonatronarchaeales archaeon]